MAVVRASLDLDPSQLQTVQEAADWNDLPVQAFLNACLQSGIAHAEALMRDGRTLFTRQDKPDPDPYGDGIPF